MATSDPLYPVDSSACSYAKHSVHSTLLSRNVTISGRRTSVRLEPEMWDGLREICRRERNSLHQICTSISLQRPDQTSLTAAIRVFTMRYFRIASTEEGHTKAGHGYGLTLAMGLNQNQTSPQAAPMAMNKRSFA
jgi:predicted DNA-binding ribbon-helix-helix protein